MLNTKEIRVRVTPEQYALIKTRTQLFGYTSISAFVRDRVIKIPYQTEQRLIEIHQILKSRK